jgi:hypothetical protein
MSGDRRRTVEYLRFVATAVAVAVALGLAGIWPTIRLAGAAALPALGAGCAVAVIASALGGLPLALHGPEPVKRPQAVLLATTLRLLSVIALGSAALASGRFAGRPLVLWTALCYVALLAVDSRYAMRTAGGTRAQGGPGNLAGI